MKLFVLGSCRVHNPLRRAMLAGLCDHSNLVAPLWFLHTSHAAYQSLQLVTGDIAPPVHLLDLMFEAKDVHAIDFRMPHVLEQADVLVVEHCSLAHLQIDGWSVNQHRIHHAKKANDPRLASLVRSTSTPEMIADTLSLIRTKVSQPVLVVNHIAITGSAALDDTRQRLTDALSFATAQAGCHLFDTSTLLERSTPARSLVDVNHYQPEFEALVGQAIVQRISGIV